MASWGGLNPALTAWRNGINARFPRRGTASDGGYADLLHGSTSQHQPDRDGTVDAFDCDVNFTGSADPDGDTFEDCVAEALKKDFAADRRAQLWIHDRQIANADIGPWTRRPYSGANPHDKHIHFQSRQEFERDGSPWRFTHTDALLAPPKPLEDIVELSANDRKWLTDQFAAVPARVWGFDVNPDPAVSQTAYGALITGLARTGALANTLVPGLISAVAEVAQGQVNPEELAAAVAERLPAGEVTVDKLKTAIVGAVRELITPSAAS